MGQRESLLQSPHLLSNSILAMAWRMVYLYEWMYEALQRNTQEECLGIAGFGMYKTH